jgi:hypothetical protein
MSSDPSMAAEHPASALPIEARPGEFGSTRVPGVAGVGIVTLASDHALRREVADRENVPVSLAGRTDDAPAAAPRPPPQVAVAPTARRPNDSGSGCALAGASICSTASAPQVPAPAVVADQMPAAKPGPRERCGSRQLLAPWNCTGRQGRNAVVRWHPGCVERRIEQERRANPTQ